MSPILEFFERGGTVMYVLVGLSVVTLSVFLYRVWAMRRIHVLPHDARRQILSAAKDGDWDVASTEAERSETAFGRIATDLFRVRDWGETQRRERLQESGKREAAELERWSGVIGTVATIAPLMGLLGTIVGMIDTFRSVQTTAIETGMPSVPDMADGIWQALLTTAAGLTLAIPAFVAYRWLTARVDAWTLELEEASSELLHAIEVGSTGATSAGVADAAGDE